MEVNYTDLASIFSLFPIVVRDDVGLLACSAQSVDKLHSQKFEAHRSYRFTFSSSQRATRF